jgi:diaminopimelate decarboxylase
VKNPINYKSGKISFDGKLVSTLVKKYPTPFYLYSKRLFKDNFQTFEKAAKKAGVPNPKICFAMKSNSNLDVLKTLKKAGSGVDIVSVGELKLALKAGFTPKDVVFSGVGKTEEEIKFALRKNIYSFNVESIEELEQINSLAGKLKKRARICFRLNPQVDVKTHKHISTGNKTHKFGILAEDIVEASKNKKLWTHSDLKGISFHIGSQLTCFKATKKAIKNLCKCAKATGADLEFLDVGGGLGIDYQHQRGLNPNIDEYMGIVSKQIKKYYGDIPTVVFEPGRIIAARAGIFVASVIRNKTSEDYRFVIVDGGMNDFMRPSLYDAYHEIYPNKKVTSKTKVINMDIVGPICETADCFGSNRKLPANLKHGDFLVIADTGAYGHTMSNNYNMREKPKEILI